eukprot:4646325-Pleurochrysis_carterae.AAC.3
MIAFSPCFRFTRRYPNSLVLSPNWVVPFPPSLQTLPAALDRMHAVCARYVPRYVPDSSAQVRARHAFACFRSDRAPPRPQTAPAYKLGPRMHHPSHLHSVRASMLADATIPAIDDGTNA